MQRSVDATGKQRSGVAIVAWRMYRRKGRKKARKKERKQERRK